jgi:UrcA family protein
MKILPALGSIVLMSCAVVIAAGKANAGEPELPQRIVSYADLNLNSTAGAKTLYQRIRTAAKAVCGSPYERMHRMQKAARACVQHAIDDAVTQVGNRNLTALHEATAGKDRREILARR